MTKARLVPCRDQALRLDPNPLTSDIAAHLSMLDELRRRIDAFDVVHFHTDLLHLPLFRDVARRTVTTLHGRLDLADLANFYERHAEFALVSISDDQRRPLAGANWLGTVPHGLPPSLYPLTPFPRGDYLAFLGRMSPEKRPDRAIRIALQAGMRLKMAAKVADADRAWFEREIRPMLGHPLVEFVGEIDDLEKARFLGEVHAQDHRIASGWCSTPSAACVSGRTVWTWRGRRIVSPATPPPPTSR